jgi:ferredoxin
MCIGCETCIEKCPIDAITMNSDNKAGVNDKICLGCGVCAHFCPEGAISLLEGMRNIFAQSPQYE